MITRELVLRMVIIGDFNTGKSCILKRLSGKDINLNLEPTIGVDYENINKTIINDDGSVDSYKIHIWDTGGHERFQALTPSYYRNTCCAFVVYDITDIRSFNNCKKWIVKYKKLSDNDKNIFLIGNKTDLFNKRMVSIEDGKKLADEFECNFLECSAKTDKSIDSIIETLIHNIKHDVINGKLNCSSNALTYHIKNDFMDELTMGNNKIMKNNCCIIS